MIEILALLGLIVAQENGLSVPASCWVILTIATVLHVLAVAAKVKGDGL